MVTKDMFYEAAEIIFSGLGPEFTSGVLAGYCEARGALRLSSASYMPASNGIVERHISIIKSLFFRLYESALEDLANGNVGVTDVRQKTVPAQLKAPLSMCAKSVADVRNQ